MKREVGAALCQCKDGKIRLGPKSVGTRNRVSIKLECPPGCHPTGSIHTHPDSDSFPSSADIKNLSKKGLTKSCVIGKQGLRCYDIRKLNRR